MAGDVSSLAVKRLENVEYLDWLPPGFVAADFCRSKGSRLRGWVSSIYVHAGWKREQEKCRYDRALLKSIPSNTCPNQSSTVGMLACLIYSVSSRRSQKRWGCGAPREAVLQMWLCLRHTVFWTVQLLRYNDSITDITSDDNWTHQSPFSSPGPELSLF